MAEIADNDQFGLTLDGHNERINRSDEELGMFRLDEHIDSSEATLEQAQLTLEALVAMQKWWELPNGVNRVVRALDQRNNAKRTLEYWLGASRIIRDWNEIERQRVAETIVGGELQTPHLHPWVVELAASYRRRSFAAYVDAEAARDIASDFEPKEDPGDDAQ